MAQPSTPVRQISSVASTPQTGTWKHPRFDEIARRQSASTFSDRNLKKVVYNGGGLFALWAFGAFTSANLPSLFHAAEPFQPYSSYLYNLLRVVLVINIGVALWPLLRRKDDLADIALTPAQRKLLGLPASEGPATPGAAYVTPPRYPRSATPQSGSPSNAFNRSTASDKHSATPGSSKTSPFAPSASPLLSRTSGALGSGKRSSFGSPSPLGFGASKGSFFDTPGTPSPSAGKGPSVSLNNKWLWEKGRRSSSDARMLS